MVSFGECQPDRYGCSRWLNTIYLSYSGFRNMEKEWYVLVSVSQLGGASRLLIALYSGFRNMDKEWN